MELRYKQNVMHANLSSQKISFNFATKKCPILTNIEHMVC